jgi:hypothetical protein
MTHLAMDNFEFTMTGYGMVALIKALECVDMRYSKVEGWKKTGNELCMFWAANGETTNQLIIPVKPSSMVAMIEAWLQAQTYPPEPDHDGSNSKGWKITTKRDAKPWSFAFTIEPCWAMHGK